MMWISAQARREEKVSAPATPPHLVAPAEPNVALRAGLAAARDRHGDGLAVVWCGVGVGGVG